MTPKRPDRRGLAIVPALVCLLLVAMLCGSMLKLAQARRGVARGGERAAQAEWLAESGAARASARLAADKDYKGEVWEVPAAAAEHREAGRVTIAVETVKDHPGRRRVRVEADYPRGEGRRARQSKQVTVELRTETQGGPS